MIKIVGLFILTFWSFQAFPCEEINLQTQKNSPLQDIPVYNQNGLGACYAYAASQLIDYQRFKANAKNRTTTHPVWVALSYSDATWGKNDLTGGDVKSSIDHIYKFGVCERTVVDKALTKYKNGNDITDAELMDLIEKIYKAWGKRENKTINDVYDDAVGVCRASNKIKNSMFDNIFSGFENNNGKFSKVLPRVLLKDILDDCKGKNIYKPAMKAPTSSCSNCTDNGIDSKISELLKSNQPVGISYCASVIMGNKNYRGIADSRNDNVRILNRSSRVIAESDVTSKTDSGKQVDLKKCGRHASLIVGSRKQNNKCQYLLRNSWGSTSYKDFPDCLCETSKGKYVNCKHADGKPNKVGCWVDRDSLTPNIYELTHF